MGLDFALCSTPRRGVETRQRCVLTDALRPDTSSTATQSGAVTRRGVAKRSRSLRDLDRRSRVCGKLCSGTIVLGMCLLAAGLIRDSAARAPSI